MFWQDEWCLVYRLIITILQEMQDQLLQQSSGIEMLVVLKQSDALNYGNASYWAVILK